jgi:hypothetical protein
MLATTHAIAELVESVRRGGTVYPAGYQFERLSVTERTAVCRDGEGRCVRLPRTAIRDVRPAAPPKPPHATLADLVRRGLVASGRVLVTGDGGAA